MSNIQDTVSNVMKIFNEEYRDKFKISESRLKIWCQMLREYDSETILAAAYHLVSTRQDWPPDIATMRQAVVYLSKGELNRPDPMEAWGNVLKKLNEPHISYVNDEKPVFNLSPMEKEAVSRVSSIYNLKNSSNLASDRARFIEAFKGLLEERDREWLALPEVKKIAEKRQLTLLEGESEKRLSGIINGVGK